MQYERIPLPQHQRLLWKRSIILFYIMGGRRAIVIVDKRFHNLLVKNFTFSTENHFEFLSPRVRYMRV